MKIRPVGAYLFHADRRLDGRDRHDKAIIVNDYQQDAIILAYLIIPNQLYMFGAMSSPIIRSTWLYLQHMVLSTGIAAGCQPAAIPVDYIRWCNYSQVLLMMGEDIAPNMYSWLGINT